MNSSSHVIPSVELKGSLSERLRTIDAAIVQLETLRRALAGEPVPARGGGYEGPSAYANARAWPWFAAGMLFGALFVLLTLMARGCAS